MQQEQVAEARKLLLLSRAEALRFQSMPTSRAAGVLQPLVVGQPDFRPRIRQLMEAMGLDLLQRVREDSAEEAGR
jgi:hypothetical protein